MSTKHAERDLNDRTVSELRAALKSLGGTPGKKRKRELIHEIRSKRSESARHPKIVAGCALVVVVLAFVAAWASSSSTFTSSSFCSQKFSSSSIIHSKSDGIAWNDALTRVVGRICVFDSLEPHAVSAHVQSDSTVHIDALVKALGRDPRVLVVDGGDVVGIVDDALNRRPDGAFLVILSGLSAALNMRLKDHIDSKIITTTTGKDVSTKNIGFLFLNADMSLSECLDGDLSTQHFDEQVMGYHHNLIGRIAYKTRICSDVSTR